MKMYLSTLSLVPLSIRVRRDGGGSAAVALPSSPRRTPGRSEPDIARHHDAVLAHFVHQLRLLNLGLDSPSCGLQR